jgi:AcrR family transcriptional regulator
MARSIPLRAFVVACGGPKRLLTWCRRMAGMSFGAMRMAGIVAGPASDGKHKPVRTVHRTALSTDTSAARARILDAFASSLLEQPYDRLKVTELLRRARVGRTTFYAQFRDKEAVFEASVQRLGEGMVRAALAEPGAWGFVLPFLRHVDGHRSIYSSFVGTPSAPVLERHLQRLFARLLADDLARRGRAAPDALRQAVLVGALWALMVAWIERRITLGPEALALAAARVLDALMPR